MSDSDDELLPDGVPAFDDPAYDDLRGLLADARVTDPMPEDVADRLDEALAGLGEERRSERATVVPLRRARLTRRLLSAAAVVAVVGAGGVGLAQVIDDGSLNIAGSSGSDGSGDEAATADNAPSAASDEKAPADSGGIDLDGAAEERGYAARTSAVPQLRTATFASGAARVLNLSVTRLSKLNESLRYATGTDSLTDKSETDSGPEPSTPEAQSPSPPPTNGPSGLGELGAANNLSAQALAKKALACTPPVIEGSTAYPILLDGKPAILVVHEAAFGLRVVQAWSCDGEKVLTTAAVPQ